MPKPTNKLTAAALRAAKYEGRPHKIADGGGLYLHVTASGKYWRMKYRADGREKLLSFGVYPRVSLAEARQARDEAKARLARGEDPQEAKRASRETRADTFRVLAEDWMERKRSELAEDTLRLTRSRLETWVFPEIGQRPVREIEPPDVLRLLRVPESRGKHETAHRLRQRIGQIFRYAIATGRADRDPTTDLKGALASTPTKHRAAITTPNEVADLLRAIDHYDGQPSTWAALRMLALTFVRSGELRGATWDEIDLDEGTWRIPDARMKMRQPHIVPLSEQACECLRWLHALTGPDGLVFKGLRPGKPISENTLLASLRNLGYASSEMTPHGFRATASTLLHELGWPPEVIELQLAHAQRSQVAAAYNRSARLLERREMMQAWADHLDTLREGDQDNVVPIRSA